MANNEERMMCEPSLMRRAQVCLKTVHGGQNGHRAGQYRPRLLHLSQILSNAVCGALGGEEKLPMAVGCRLANEVPNARRSVLVDLSSTYNFSGIPLQNETLFSRVEQCECRPVLLKP